MIQKDYPIIRSDEKFEFLFYDIKGELFPKDHRLVCQVELSVRSLIDELSSLTLVLHPTLEVENVSSSGETLVYDRDGVALKVSLKQTLQKGDEQTFKIDYQGELIAIGPDGYYDGYIGEEGIFMRTFAGWYPYCTIGPECFFFPDVPYLLEMLAPLDWTLFAHPESPEIEQEDDHVVYRWDGRQTHQRIPHWGIVLIGGKYHQTERKINDHKLTFFGLSRKDDSTDKFIANLSELVSWLDEISNVPSLPRNFRLAETASFLHPTYQPEHTQFYSSARFDYPRSLMLLLIWDDIRLWQRLSDARCIDPLAFELGNHLHQLFWTEKQKESPQGWLSADLERRLRGYLGIIQRKSQPLSWEQVSSTKGVWAWWMWRQMVGGETFSRALCRLRTGAFPKNTVIDPTDFFSLTSDEAGLPFDWFWQQWMERTSAPQVKFSRVRVEELQGSFLVEVTIHQPGDLYHLPLSIVLRTAEGEFVQSIFMKERDYPLAFRCQSEPIELEIDPERKVMKVPSDETFKTVHLGFDIAFSGGRHGASIPITDEVLRYGKRIVIVPPELKDIAEALKPYLEKRLGNPQQLVTDEPSVNRIQLMPIPVEIYHPDEVTEELLKNHNLVLIGTPEDNPLIEQMTRHAMMFNSHQISAGEAVIENKEQGLIAFFEHPQNAQRFCLIVTALRNEALKQPPDFTEMLGDYLIYQKGEPFQVGFQNPYRWVYRIR
jgi:hypothetical protein